MEKHLGFWRRSRTLETSSAFGLTDLISTRWSSIEKIKLVIATNGNFSARTDAEAIGPVDGKPITLSVWDLKRLKQFMDRGQARSDLKIDFQHDFLQHFDSQF